jgi:ribose-phosphate pyrophosphokinase
MVSSPKRGCKNTDFSIHSTQLWKKICFWLVSLQKMPTFAARKKIIFSPMSGKVVSIFAGRATADLGAKIAEAYGAPLGKSSVVVFSDHEFQPSFDESIRGNHVFIVQSTIPPTDNLMELLLMIDAAKRASAHKIIAVIPYFGWARQDRKDQPRVSIGAKLVANLLVAAGVDRIITLDLHADQIQGFFDIPVDALYASTLFIDHIQRMHIDNLLIAAPDLGASKRASAYAKRLGCDLAICHKHRPRANVVDSMTLIGDVTDKNVIIVDDIIDTAGTIVKAGQLMMDNGAKSVRAFATHAVCSGPAMERLDNSVFSEVVVTDSIPLPAHASKKINVVSTAPLFADVIHRVESYASISSLFK